MITASTLITSQNLPIIDMHDEVEVAREQCFTNLIRPKVADLLPEGRALPPLGAVLDLPCGQGTLVQDLAYEYPELEVAGVDVFPALMASNSAQARALSLINASFGVVDLYQSPFDFSEASFDLITASFLQSRLQERDFPPLFAECARILKPGGWLRLVECEAGRCTSGAVEELSLRYDQAVARAGLHPIPANLAHDLDDRGALRAMLAEADLPVSAVRRVTLDFSAHEAANAPMQRVILVFFEQVKPFLLRMQMVSEEEYDALMRQAACEMSMLGFQGSWHLLVLWGQKSASAGEIVQAMASLRNGRGGEGNYVSSTSC